MNLDNIINEELDAMIAELAEAAGTGNIETFNYRPVRDDGLYYQVDVVVPERTDKSGNTTPQQTVKFDVTFGKAGNQDEKAISIAFRKTTGSHSDKTGFGVQFKLLATITKIVTEVAERYDPDIFVFSPVKETDVDPSKGNRRMMLYMRYVQSGAGADYDGFIIGNDYAVSVEKKNPSYPIENGYQEPETIQDIITQLSKYHGRYESVLPRNDPDYSLFTMSDYGSMTEEGSHRRRHTISARRFVDWILDNPTVRYVQGRSDPDRTDEPEVYSTPATSTQPVDAPIQRINDPLARHGTGAVGTFQHFMQTQVYGAPRYQPLEPFYNNVKDLEAFGELRADTERQMWNADDQNRGRLQDIIDSIDRLSMAYTQYERENRVNETLNRIVTNLNELLS